MRGDKTQKVSVMSPSLRTGWRFLPKVDSSIFFLRKNSEGFLWDSLVLMWNVSLAADWVDGQGRVGSKTEHSLKFLKILSVSRLLGALSMFHQSHLRLCWVSVHGLPLLCMLKSRESCVLCHSTCSSVCAKQWSEVVLEHFLVSDYR